MALGTHQAGHLPAKLPNGSQASDPTSVEIGLNAAIVSVASPDPVVLVTQMREQERFAADALPAGVFSPHRHATLEAGLRSWVAEQTSLHLGTIEQLCTFSDRRNPVPPGDGAGSHILSIGYLALARPDVGAQLKRGVWRSWYEFFPWEDWRLGKPKILAEVIEPRLNAWAERSDPSFGPARSHAREDALRLSFGLYGGPWDEEKVLDRYELLYEAGLVEEARRDGREASRCWDTVSDRSVRLDLGMPMQADHRRVLATAIGRLRTKLKFRPVVFELMPPDFTLFELQRTVEAVLGPHLHKQNFRRLVEGGGLVEPTGEVRSKTGGRPARLYRFRREVMLERSAPGVRVNTGRAQQQHAS
jgi:hypothetical protein